MMKNIPETELNPAKEIIGRGLKKSAEAFSFFMKEPIDHKDPLLSADGVRDFLKIFPADEKLYVLSTELKGEFTGICFLVLSPDEGETLANISFGESMKKNAERFQTMKEALLLEVDNIISATVVTQLSEILSYQVFGGVPRLSLMNRTEFETTAVKYHNDKFPLTCNTGFRSQSGHFTPEFCWIFDTEFLNAVKKHQEKVYESQ